MWDSTGSWQGTAKLDTFAPAAMTSDVQAGDLDGDGDDEIVVSTAIGKVVWLELSELLGTGTTSLALTRNVVVAQPYPVPPSLPWEMHDHRTNATLHATWAIDGLPAQGSTVGTLHAVDRNGVWWQIDPRNGAPMVPSGGVPKQLSFAPLMLRHGGTGGGVGVNGMTP